MKTEILEELAKGNWSSKPRRLILNRVIKFVIVCLILTLLFWLVLLEDYSTLFFLLGGVSGFLIFMSLRFLENRFGKEKLKEDSDDSPEVRKLASIEKTKQRNVVGDRD